VFRRKGAWLLEKACPYKIAGSVSQPKLTAYSPALCHSDQQQEGVTGILLIFWQGSASRNLINKSIVTNGNNCKDVVCGSTSYHCCGNATRHVIRLGNCCSNTKVYSMSPTEGVNVGEVHRQTELAKGLSEVSEQGQHQLPGCWGSHGSNWRGARQHAGGSVYALWNSQLVKSFWGIC